MRRTALARADGWLRRLRPAHLFWTIALVDLILVLVVISTAFMPREARLSVQARTQRLSIAVPRQLTFASWGDVSPTTVYSADVPDLAECGSPEVAFEPSIAGPLGIVAQTTAEDGLAVEFRFAGGQRPVTVSCDGRPDIRPANALLLRWDRDAAKTLNLPFSGELTLGDDLRADMPDQRILLGGSITVEASSAPFRSGRTTSESKLFAGDRFFIARSSSGEAMAIANGVMRMNEDHELEVTAHSTAAEGRVVHPGQRDTIATSVAPDFWTKLQAQPEWTLAIVIGALLLNVLAALQAYMTADTPPSAEPKRTRATRRGTTRS